MLTTVGYVGGAIAFLAGIKTTQTPTTTAAQQTSTLHPTRLI